MRCKILFAGVHIDTGWNIFNDVEFAILEQRVGDNLFYQPLMPLSILHNYYLLLVRNPIHSVGSGS